jgi:PAS domain S-box-containing protein
MLDNMLEGCQIIGFDWRYRYVNHAAAAQGRQSREALLGRTMMEVYPGIEQTALFVALRRCLNERAAGKMENEFVFPDGSKGWFELSIEPVPEGLFILSIDITERVQAEAALRERERQMRALVTSLDDLVFEFDEQATYLNVWTADERLLARPRAELIGRRIAEVLGEDAARPFVDAIRRVLNSNQVEELEYPLDVASGRRWFLARISPIVSTDNPGRTVSMLVRDVTTRRQAEEAHRVSEEKLRLFIEHAPAALAMFDREMRYLAVSRRWMADYGLGEQDIIGRSHYEVLPEIPDRWKAIHRRGLAGEVVQAEEDRFVRADGAVQWLRWVVRPWNTADGGVGGIVIFTEDITGHKQAEAQLAHSAAEVAALYRATTSLLHIQSDLASLAQEIAEAVTQEFALADCGVLLADEAQAELKRIARAGNYDMTTATLLSFSDPGLIVAAFRRGEIIYAPEASADLRYTPGDPRTRSELVVPLSVGSQVIGVLDLQSPEPDAFDERARRVVAAYAERAALALQNTLLHAQAEQQLQRLFALRTIDTAITGSLDLRLTLSILLEQVVSQLRVDAADVLLLDRHTHTLDHAAGRGFRSKSIERTRLSMGQGLAGQAALERRTVQRADLTLNDPAFTRAGLLADEGFRSYYGVPLMAKGNVEGVLEIFHRTPLRPDADWLGFLEALAGQAAIAIDNAKLFTQLQRSNQHLMIAYDATIEGWSQALDLRDKETEGHTQRVTEMTLDLARAIRAFRDDDLVHLRRGALLHDIGKMGVPDHVLLKPGPLTDDEWVLMRRHPVLAYEMLSRIAYLRPALDIPYCHHEKWDGSGYPRGLKGEQIPLAARIFAVVDVWDALRSDRPYRAAWPEEKVREHIQSLAGTHFDPQITEAFLQMMGGTKDAGL